MQMNGLTLTWWLSFAKKAEKLGYEIFMTYDHYMLPASNKTFEMWILLSFVAVKT